MSKEEFTTEDSIAGVAAAITLNYDMLLEILRDHIKHEYVSAVADVNPGATAYLDEEAAGIWDAAMKVVLDRYLATMRPNPDDEIQLEIVALVVGPYLPIAMRPSVVARNVLTALAKGRTS